jgi:hypothetical protein
MHVLGQRISLQGTLVGGNITIMTDPWHQEIKAAYNAQMGEFAVIAAYCTSSCGIKFQRVSQAGNLVGAPVPIVSGLAGALIPQIVWNPHEGQYMAAWLTDAYRGRRLAFDGSAVGADFVIGPNAGSGFEIALSLVSNTYFAVFHSQDSYDDDGREFTHTGQVGQLFRVTAAAATIGMFEPRVAAHPTRREWVVTASRDFNAVVVQRVLSTR